MALTASVSSVLRCLTLFLAGLMLTACSSMNPFNWFSSSGPKPAELKDIKTTLAVKQAWSVSVGSAGKFSFQPAISDGVVYTAATDGTLNKIDLKSGRILWRVQAKTKLSAGVGSDGHILAVGTSDGVVLAFDAADGKLRWQAQTSSEIISPPAVNGELVLVRSVDGRVSAFDAGSGKARWISQRPLPVLTLRNPGGMLVTATTAFVGYPGGKLVALALNNGVARWDVSVASPKGVTELERIADVTGTPQIQGREVCAATYQGRVACFDAVSGETIWARPVSTGNGLGLDVLYAFVSDETGNVLAFSRQGGASVWRQDQLTYRSLTQPVSSGRAVVVGDLEGVVHWLSRDDGAFIARARTDGSPIVAAPQTVLNGVLIQTSGGTLTAFTYE
ncbi:MAG: outer membrane protein assembly factor BamB [Burkholderiaceae bacterium]|nr:MAG: outer membrane protein assembly factor BamB [Burkholderiaceae bacterium]